jgi:hypothetical protein
MVTLSPLCQLNGGCMGCCGHDFLSKNKTKEAITKNTKQFYSQNIKTKTAYLEFRDRYDITNLKNGVCRNLIEKEGCFLCPLHPSLHKDEDLREGHCDVNYLCKSAHEFSKWDEVKKKRFIDFIKKKELDNLSYSMKMDNNSLIDEFLENEF